MTALCAAIRLAATVHDEQTDKAGAPYILHPLRIMAQCKTDDERIVAVLHDVVEDSPSITLTDIHRLFGQGIHDAVDALTKRGGEGYEAFIERCGANRLARIVKRRDLIDNMDLSRLRTITPADKQRREKYSRALIYLRGLG